MIALQQNFKIDSDQNQLRMKLRCRTKLILRHIVKVTFLCTTKDHPLSNNKKGIGKIEYYWTLGNNTILYICRMMLCGRGLHLILIISYIK